jgi:hypothetical protein
MASKEQSRADILVYFTGSAARKCDQELQVIEKVELWKFLSAQVPVERKRELGALIERMCELPSYAYAKEVARHFGCKWFFTRIGFTAGLTQLVNVGMLINPVPPVFGLSPNLLMQLGLLDKFLGKANGHTAHGIWEWVRQEIRNVAAAQSELKARGINIWK